jgi:hypothetical protein
MKLQLPSWAKKVTAWGGILSAVAAAVVIVVNLTAWCYTHSLEAQRTRDTVARHTTENAETESRLSRVESTVNKIDGKVDVVIKILSKPSNADAVARGTP